MRHLFLLTCLLFIGRPSVEAAGSPVDSLRHVLSRTTDPAEQISIYRNLADLTFGTPEAKKYLTSLVDKARELGQTQVVMEALADLVDNNIMRSQPDSVRYNIALAERYAPKDQRDQWCCYLRMRLFMSDLNDENAEQAIEERTAEFRDRDIARESLYRQIEAEYILGLAIDDKSLPEEALPHMHKALELSQKLPFREGCPYQLLIMRQLSRIYNSMRETPKAAEIIKNSIAVKEKYYNQYDKAERPFYPIDDFYITNYSSLLINVEKQPDEESRYYLKRLVEMSDRSNNPAHKYSRFQAQYNYVISKRNLQQALIYNDSLIHYARQIAAYSLPNLYKLNSVLYELLGENKNALTNLKESYRLQDSIRQQSAQEKFDKLRVEYDLNRLNYEKSQLEVRNKLFLVIGLSVLLLAVITICIFLYHHLRRERRRKEHMQRLKMQAEESEKLKTGFINSMCHEIRTPLNGIVGFSNLLLDPTLDEEERSTFPEEIQRNSAQLISLVDSMLEVSNLDVSDAKLPCTDVDLVTLCQAAFEKFGTGENGPTSGIIRLPEGELIVSTHKYYLSLVIENLLANAFKFTSRGSVTLDCEQRGNEVVLSVTDTGCGIPAEKREVVFERFTKLNFHTQGSGLGLYLCKLVIHRLSGRIYIAPDYTNGTRVVVILPLV